MSKQTIDTSLVREKILAFYEDIKALSTLMPDEATSKVFSNLCHFVQTTNYSWSLPDQESHYIREAAAQAETFMEVETTEKILIAKDKRKQLESFIYYQNYSDLTEMEYATIQLLQKDSKKILFIGWWPLPLTAIILAKSYGCHVTVIDRDEIAVRLSQKLVQSLWLEDLITIVQQDVMDFTSDASFDCTVVASLLFGNGQENDILSQIKTIPSSCYLLRSADWLKRLLYAGISETMLSDHFSLKYVIHPHNHIINSLVLATWL